MILKTEIQDSTQKALIVTRADTIFVKKLKRRLKEMKIEVYTSPHVPENVDQYDVCFFIQFDEVLLPTFREMTSTKFVFVFFDQEDTAQLFSSFAYKNNITHIKVLNLQTYPNYYDKDLETIFWFSFSRSEDVFLHLFHQPVTTNSQHPTKKKNRRTWKQWWTPKKLIVSGLSLVFLAQFLFLPALLLSTLYHYQVYELLQSGKTTSVPSHAEKAASALETSKRMYAFSQPILHFLSISLPFEDLIQINGSVSVLLTKGITLRTNAQIITNGLFLTSKTPAETQRILKAKDELVAEIPTVHDHIQILEAKLPMWNDDFIRAHDALKEADESLTLFEMFTPHLDTIFARDTEKKYLLLFANNMELRPGGGFIGSFGIARVNNYSVIDINVYDVYDADGQLTTRIPPPEPISEYLEQPFWYLRDSAFSGDFPENVQNAEMFLELELNEKDFDGAILITATGVKHLLSAVDTLYIPDYQETITGENFYLKAQLYAEQDFFPGSTQKKSFLSDVMTQMMLALPDANPQILMKQMKSAIDEKQMVLYSKDAALQNLFEEQYWAGSTLRPECTVVTSESCISDYLYQLDANLGVNKANFFIRRPTSLQVSIDPSGTITNTLSVIYENDSEVGVFPGGTYKNYVQTLLPPNALVRSVTVDGQSISDFTETNFSYKTIGLFLTVDPQQKKELKIIYRLPTTIIQGDGLYQLILQKQVGSPHYDFKFSMDIPENMKVTRHNLSPLAQDAKIHYNTSVSSDKIFLIEFSKN